MPPWPGNEYGEPVTDTQPLPAGSAEPVGFAGSEGRGRPWAALRLEFAIRSWLRGWAAITHLIADLTLSLPYLLLSLMLLGGVAMLPVMLIGLPLLVIVQVAGFGLAAFERARIQAVLGLRIDAPARPPGRPRLWRRVLLDPRAWRAQLYLFLISLWGLTAGLIVTALASISLAAVAVPVYAAALPHGHLALPWNGQISGIWWFSLVFVIGIFGMLITPLLAAAMVLLDVLLARWLIGPSRSDQSAQVAQLSERVQTLTETREAAVDSVEAERRRIERDLHDGPQQRLVAIAMDLGMAQERIDRDPASARELLDKAHSAAKAAVTEMRQVARGIHPPVLTDRGLNAALSALAAGSPVPVTVDVDLPARPSATVEAIAYFSVSEALTNVAKHARAHSARVRIDQVAIDGAGDQVRIEVSDDGVGGADSAVGGTGLTGLTDRVRAIDGTLAISSPPGGPTVLTILLPFQLPERSR
jgi:signal transduction histidine kinase